MRAASLEGRWTLPAPIGYCNVTTNGSCRLEQDPARAPLIRMPFELFASGQFDQEQVLRKVTAQGLRTRRGKKLSRQSFSALLRKPIYAGRISLSCWEIDRTETLHLLSRRMFSFEFTGFLLAEECRRSPIKSSTPDFPLRPHCKLNISKMKMETEFIELMKMLQPKPEYLRLFEAIVLDVWNEQRSQVNKTLESLNKRLETIRERSNQLTEAFVYDKSIDRETYQVQLGRLREDQLWVEMQLNESRVDEFDVQSAINFAALSNWRCVSLLASSVRSNKNTGSNERFS